MASTRQPLPPQNDFASRLDEALRDADKTQNALEQQVGSAHGNISRLRTRGAQRIEPETLFAIADALNVDARWLFTGRGEKLPGSKSDAAESAEVARLRERVASLQEAIHAIENMCRGALRRART